ncbi:hypothetical protein BKA70DRAFT_1407275 [Coprinopsis sp. MPI-PUGE-AT-0042]|nr:hypothetical protein BKA70DRAFT_1407275 [Coprinopsis sp. MPI-PUGE-AT-0042]
MADTATSAVCTILGNPDIAGIGVRTAIYAQNFLSFLPAIWALMDGKVTQKELDYAELLTSTNLVLAFAILISSLVQACTLGLTSYHASIVLSMSWMNNTNVFIYFILYIHHNIGLPEGEGRVDVTWVAWVDHIKVVLFVPRRSSDPESRTTLAQSGRSRASMLIRRFMLISGSLHLTLMAALGIWLWSAPLEFGRGKTEVALFGDANGCAISHALLTVIGQQVPFNSQPLRIASLVIYSMFLFPALNLILPMGVFLAFYIACRRIATGPHGIVLHPDFLGLALLLAVNLVFLVDIELTLRHNSDLQDLNEGKWGFGQILAILLLFLPIRDLLDVKSILSNAVKRRQAELEEDLLEALEREEYDRITRAIKRGSSFPSPKSPDQHLKFWTLVSAHGDLEYFTSLRRTRITTAERALESDLRAAIQAEDEPRITAAYSQGADLIAGVLQLSNEAIGMVFWYALRMGNEHIARFYASQPGQHVNERGPGGTTPLTFALERDDSSLACALLENPDIAVNLQDASGRRPLVVAVQHVREDVIKMHLERDDIELNAGDRDGLTPLAWASREGRS